MGILSIFKKIKEEGQALKGNPVKDKIYTSEHEYKDSKTAMIEFVRSKEKLFSVDMWSAMPGVTATFELHDQNGNRLPNEKVKENHYIRIIIPGSSSENWVKITKVRDHKDVAYFIASPSENPTNPQDGKIEHFFVKEATSTFKVEWKGNKIQAFEIGKNEGVNMGDYAGKRDLVNTLLSVGGWAGFQRLQWKNLTNFLVHINE